MGLWKQHYLLNYRNFNSEKMLARLCEYYDDVVIVNLVTGYAVPLKLSEHLEDILGVKTFDWNYGLTLALKNEVKEEDYEQSLVDMGLDSLKKMFVDSYDEFIVTYPDLEGIMRRIIFIPEEMEGKVTHVFVGYVRSKHLDLEAAKPYTTRGGGNQENLLLRFAVEDVYKAVLKIDLSSWLVTVISYADGEITEFVRKERWDVGYNNIMNYVESKNVQEVKDCISPHALINAEVGAVKSVSLSFSGFSEHSDYEELTAITRVVYEGDNKTAIIFIVDDTKKMKERKQHEYEVMQELHREKQFRRALLADAMGYFEINLSRNMITKYKTHKKRRPVDVPDIVGMKVPCNFTEFAERALQKGVFGKSEEFRDFFNIDKMFERYERGKDYYSKVFPATYKDGSKYFVKLIVVLSKEPTSNDLVAIVVGKDMTEYMDEEELTMDE